VTDDQLDRALRSIGTGCFVTHLPLFCDDRRSSADIAAELVHLYTAKAATSRTTHARRIIAAGRISDALHRVIASDRIAPALRQAAQHALRDTGK
jgi:hypothetical protein